MMQDSLMETLKSMGLSQTSDTNNRVMVPEAQTEQLVVTGSAKGSCSPAPVKMQNELKEVVVTESAKGSRSPAPVAEAQDNMDDVQKLLMMVLKRGDDHLDVELIHCSMCTNFLMSCKCIRELLVGFIWLDMSTLSVWCSTVYQVMEFYDAVAEKHSLTAHELFDGNDLATFLSNLHQDVGNLKAIVVWLLVASATDF
ncbi:unnamed protein product [Trifolium pratense]|uniref:Uncharacterized protein n=1 Tax=Trifolium pratense TaxID=57577 RepID=A0ACB0JLU2_TRIPR|nr:unnamed protein product [Trifolium pratense]